MRVRREAEEVKRYCARDNVPGDTSLPRVKGNEEAEG